MSSTNIGSDLQSEDTQDFSFSIDKYPFLTAELGGGIQVTQHRRPYITGEEIEAFILCTLGSGVAMLGYYMYHGGTNPKGKLSTLQESKATGMYNDLPELSYDFHAPLTEYGQMSDTFRKLRRIHLFTGDFGKELAASQVYFPDDNPQSAEDMESLRYSIRYGDLGGFLFLNNFQRRHNMSNKEDISITIETAKGIVNFPTLDLEDKNKWIFPFQITLNKVYLKWATAQLLCNIKNGADNTLVFFGDKLKETALCFSKTGILSIEAYGANVNENNEDYNISINMPDSKVYVILKLEDGSRIILLVLNEQQSERAGKVILDDQEYLIISDADIYNGPIDIRLINNKASAYLLMYPKLSKEEVLCKGVLASQDGISMQDDIGLFSNYSIKFWSLTNGKVDIPLNVVNSFKKLNNDGLAFEFSLPQEIYQLDYEWFLNIGFAGDKARLWINGELEADWFYLWIRDDWMKKGSFSNKMKKVLDTYVFSRLLRNEC